MSDKRLSDADFDAMLEESIPELPPEDIAETVTPFSKAMDRVLWGMALCTLTLNFLCLNYILPAVGMVLLLLGFRSLRRENAWFKAGFISVAVRAAYFFAALIVNTTVFQSGIYDSDFGSIAAAVNPALSFLTIICLWRGLRAVRIKAGQEPKAGAAAALVVWFVIMLGLALVEYSGIIIGLAMIIVYILIIRSLYKISAQTAETGYAITPAPVGISDKRLVQLICAVVILGIVCGYVFFGSYDMQWSEKDNDEHESLAAEKAQLAALGFPENVLDDLSAEDIAACAGAQEVAAQTQTHTVDDGSRLTVTGVGVRLSDERDTWMIFHHFRWSDDASFYGTEAIQLWPTYYNIEGWTKGEHLGGRLLCEQNGTTYAAAYNSLGDETYMQNTMFWGEQTSCDLFASFSLPSGAKGCRGYASYEAAECIDGYIISSWLNYAHQKTPLQYPAVSAMQSRMTGANRYAFSLVQDALQFYPTDTGTELIQ